MKKLTYIIFMLLANVASAFAEYDGRWYSVEDHHSSSTTGLGTVVMFIIGAICAFFIIGSIISDKDREGSEKGCLTTFCCNFDRYFICMLSQCK